jgi:hypothetical protein
MAKITCSFCNTLNDAAEKTCVGCGAPLDAPVPQPVSRPEPVQQLFQPFQTKSPFDSADSQKLQAGAQQVEQLYAGAASAYRAVWSITSDAIAIAMTAFILGAVSGAMLVGLLVGYTEQSFWVNVIASPAGALVGIVGWAIVWAAGAGPKGMVFVATGLACIGALVGARRRTTPLGCSAFVRPVLGAAGGFFFALLGLAIGWAINAVLM